MSDPLSRPNLPVIQDSADAEARSLMHKQKVLCNGEATGHPCKHYWAVCRIVDSQNSDFLTSGEKLRFCRAWGTEPLEFGDGRKEQMVYCTLYEPSERKYDEDFEVYKAISDEQLSALAPASQTVSGPMTVSITDALADDASQKEESNSDE